MLATLIAKFIKEKFQTIDYKLNRVYLSINTVNYNVQGKLRSFKKIIITKIYHKNVLLVALWEKLPFSESNKTV